MKRMSDGTVSAFREAQPFGIAYELAHDLLALRAAVRAARVLVSKAVQLTPVGSAEEEVMERVDATLRAALPEAEEGA